MDISAYLICCISFLFSLEKGKNYVIQVVELWETFNGFIKRNMDLKMKL